MLNQAMILCAGKGTRLGSLTASVPKPMLPVLTTDGPEPLLSTIVKKLKSASFRDIILVVGYRSEMIAEYFRDDEQIQFVYQAEPTGTAAALELVFPLSQSQFLLTYGDVMMDEAEYRGIRISAEHDGGNWAAVNRADRPVGAAYIQGDRITRIVEKPETCSTCWNTSGLFVLTRDVAALAGRTMPSLRGERELAQMLQMWIDGKNDLKPYFLKGVSIDVGIPERYEQVMAESTPER